MYLPMISQHMYRKVSMQTTRGSHANDTFQPNKDDNSLHKRAQPEKRR